MGTYGSYIKVLAGICRYHAMLLDFPEIVPRAFPGNSNILQSISSNHAWTTCRFAPAAASTGSHQDLEV
jgi:hypothetical protein